MEFLLIISMLMIVFLLMLQYAVKAHAQRIATAAAEDALAATAAYDGTTADGREAANEVLNDIAPGLRDATVTINRNAASASVTVTGSVIQFLPFLDIGVNVHIEGPVERFVTTSNGGAP
jgi:Flp pilus assembly protein TadG